MDLHQALAEIDRLRGELQWIANTPMKFNKSQGDIYWANIAIAMAQTAGDALKVEGK